MGDLINGRTPEEIKRGLYAHSQETLDCKECPYDGESRMDCSELMCLNALALIEHLESERDAALAKGPKWISVKERLPERHGQLCVGLYTQHGGDKSMLFPYIFTWHAYGDNGYVNGPHFSDEGLDGLKVYYWMPLPEPPEE